MNKTNATLRVDFEKCSKAGECYYNHPDLFARTESGFPAVKIRLPSSANEAREAAEAAEVCPSGAIFIE
jgi:ferredoxin